MGTSLLNKKPGVGTCPTPGSRIIVVYTIATIKCRADALALDGLQELEDRFGLFDQRVIDFGEDGGHIFGLHCDAL